MGKNKLDKTVKEKLFNLETPLDTEALWADLDQKIIRDKKTVATGWNFQKYRYLNLFILFLLIAGPVGYAFYLSSDQSATILVGANEFMTIPADDLIPTAPKTSPSEFSKESNIDADAVVVESKTNESFDNSNLDGNTYESNNSTIKPTTNTQVGLELDSKLNTQTRVGSTNQKTLKTQVLNKNRTKLTQQSQLEKLESKQNVKNETSQLKENKDQATSPEQTITQDEFSAINTFAERQKNKSTLNTGILSDQNLEETSLIENRFVNNFTLLNKNNSLLNRDNDLMDICSFKKQNNQDCYDGWMEKKSKISIIPYVGIDMVNSRLSSTETYDEYLQERRNTMRFLEVLKGGLLLKYRINKNLYAKSGVEYDQIREKFETVSIETNQVILPNQVIAYQVTMVGDTIPIYGPGSTTEITTRTWRKYNKYHSFNIPVIVGYQSQFAKRFDWYAEAGAMYNVKFSYQGTLINEINDVVTGENFFVGRTGVSLYGAGGVSYWLSKKIALTTNLSYKHNLKSINQEQFNPIDQKIGLFGIALGVEYRIM